MTTMAELTRRGIIGIVKVKHPPVNALSYGVRKGITECMKKAESDPAIQAVVLCGDGRTFPAGADISEFGGKFAEGPDLRSVLVTIENLRKPVVAAIHGTALGGGLEVALSCHYRLMHTTARTGFPEVALGILPAATGTQRFPRVTHLANAIEMITSGRHITAKEAHSKGIVDKLVSGDIIQEGVTFANDIASKPYRHLMVSTKPVIGAENAQQIFDEARKRLASRAVGGPIAPMMCLKAIEGAVKMPTFEKGIQHEADLMYLLMTSGQARAQQYAFFAERAVSKWELPDGATNSRNTKPKAVKTAAVIGAGTMGTGIAMTLLSRGIPTILIEQDQKFLDRGVAAIGKLIAYQVNKKRISNEQAQKLHTLLKPSLHYADLKDVDIVIEAVFENMDIKKTVFRKMDALCKPSAILASNTSNLNIDEMATVTKRPGSVIGMHFFAPANVMRLLENIRGRQTSGETIATVMDLSKRIGKVGVLVGNCYGFVGNRMLHMYGAEASFLIEEGCLPHEVDQCIKVFGFPMGFFQVADLSGLDIGYKARKGLGLIGKGLPERFRFGQRYSPISDIMVENGRLGQKSGKGYYNYGKIGGRVPERDPETEELILNFCKKHNIQRRRIAPQEVMERCLYPLINEGFKILQEKIATKDEEIDTIWMTGYGWPRHTGGPMYYARNFVGLPKIYERLLYYKAQFPDSKHWEPCELLRKEAMQQAKL
ncbi:peroxisomal bifunctional enzyme-like [Amphiura filiformis]|uniref:peroxisomal bifunctional enzyme-like n=1 Tax=Amphiura filiformis TaxID=82378 RepID=UPI003B21E746